MVKINENKDIMRPEAPWKPRCYFMVYRSPT